MNNEFYYIEIGISAIKYGTYYDKQKTLNLIMQNCTPEVKEAAVSTMVQEYKMNSRSTSISLNSEDLDINIKTYCEKLWLQIQKKQEWSNLTNFKSMYILYNNFNSFRKEFVLYNNDTQQIKVSDLLDAINYSLDFINIVLDIDTEKYSNCITVLKGLYKYLNNETEDRNILKDLGYVVEVFSALSNYFEKDTEQKKKNKIMSTTINLAIEFLTKM